MEMFGSEFLGYAIFGALFLLVLAGLGSVVWLAGLPVRFVFLRAFLRCISTLGLIALAISLQLIVSSVTGKLAYRKALEEANTEWYTAEWYTSREGVETATKITIAEDELSRATRWERGGDGRIYILPPFERSGWGDVSLWKKKLQGCSARIETIQLNIALLALATGMFAASMLLRKLTTIRDCPDNVVMGIVRFLFAAGWIVFAAISAYRWHYYG